jgi:predicted RNase H-like nuclease
MSSKVLGADACRAGRVGVVVHNGPPRLHVAKTTIALVADAEVDGHLAVIGIDIPIGLPDTGRRSTDVSAYQLVGPQQSAVFITPVRAALEAGSHAAAVQANGSRAGEGICAPVYGLRSPPAREKTRAASGIHPRQLRPAAATTEAAGLGAVTSRANQLLGIGPTRRG